MSFRYGAENRCSNCGNPVKGNVDKCPYCGVYFSSKRKNNKKNKPKNKKINLMSRKVLVLFVLIAIVAVGVYLLFSPVDNSVSEITHVNDISISVGENDLGLSSVLSYGYDENDGITTDFTKIVDHNVFIVLRDSNHNLTQSDIDKVISGVLSRDSSLVKINETTIGGKYNNYTYVISNG